MPPILGTWSRDLVFPTQSSASTAAPMWDRPSTMTPIFLPPTLPPSQMWSRPGTGAPIFVDEPVGDFKPMWDRSGGETVPVCPCCMANTKVSLEGHVQYGSVSSSSRSSGSETTQSWEMPDGWKLRIKKRFSRLRSMASRSSNSLKGLLV